MEAAMEALRSFDMAKAEATPADGADAAPGVDSGPHDARLAMAEDLADLRDELNRDMGSEAALALIQKIAGALPAIESSEEQPGS